MPLLEIIVRVYSFKIKLAAIDLAALIVTTQVPVPEHPEPLQPVKIESVLGVAVKVTNVL